ncbi:hypothetical protein KSS87_004485, partial [Heliosperma pusillum]
MSRRWSSVDDAVNCTSASRRNDVIDDEEALIWAAIERLPTFDRLRRAILLPDISDDTSIINLPNQVDIRCLGLQERKALALRVGIDFPTIEVRFENLNIEAEAYVGSRASPTLVNFTANLIEGLLNSLHIVSSRKKSIRIFHGISGIVRPKRLTLLLGPPGCGKTTLLLALAGKLDKSLKVSGRVTYNGHDMNEFVPQRTAAYISQDDVHIGEMTVRETLSYSA